MLSKPALFSLYQRHDKLFWIFRIWYKCINISPRPISKLLKFFLPANRKSHPYSHTLLEPHLAYTIDCHAVSKHARVFGYYQNIAYHKQIYPALLRDFTCALSHSNQALKHYIQSIPNATFIHIRRGDYLRLWEFVELGRTYYECAIAEILRRVDKPHFFIFSNDIAWCKQEFLPLLDSALLKRCEISFVDNNDESNPTQELMLMRSCKHAIIANSTFSWWAAYLITNPQKHIIMPSMFLYTNREYVQNITPEGWIVLDPIWGSRQNLSPQNPNTP